ncbi:hypothetical protein [Saccharopolyspora elongata]|uniref:Uncharacterized protein n=1 Tax=Saccharopolyspora elongata TaxID=2530387 RepID=A0A4R4ZG00_9PSEU|nr:hypothetical protein [Saccharopolyspora elongata]TDD56544.1 hypothetical protein E1288_00150 [Saccharopolyspora elongata]
MSANSTSARRKTKSIDVDHLLTNDPGLSDAVEKKIAEHKSAWKKEAVESFHKTGGQPIVLEKNLGKWDGRTADAITDWYAIGSYQYTMTGLVKATPDADGNPKVSLDYQVHATDRYNWDNLKFDPMPDFIQGMGHRVGTSQEYMRGTSKLRSIPLD